ncbi:hypothetical protein INT08_01965 [Prosthecochloris sp. N3]|uniref:Uncharacterized protein n=1 Tax=Prosthecochloris ethylica TaxID=2743976 RepID=A0ABR9XQ67_9CHLB|nr:hypothetical protein [Prosthecochloris ethylica]MBF0586245.1 hypothetical protein [Prosthecochloris ethylica]MBF0635951.1 hypothetical protein [Prosthecochloris ethylica]NUK47374.1 hypothetical protein [Prosthecochloris ethylica]
MKPICIGDYCFNHHHLWIQYHKYLPQFVEVAVEVFYPRDRQADGLIMFNHGFLIGTDLFYLPKKIAGSLLNDNPLFGVHPSAYYNYSRAAIDNNWAMAFVTATHLQASGLPWSDFGGNPRVGQEAFAVASYLIKYGATDEFYKGDEHYENTAFFDRGVIEEARFLRSNNVVFAGHSVGGAHAQVAATGFKAMQDIGKRNMQLFDPVIYDRELLPKYSRSLSSWNEQDIAQPVGLLQLSPVDQKIWPLAPGMRPYREALAEKPMPELMIIGDCDCACLDSSAPPAWSPDSGTASQFSQLAPEHSDSWSIVANLSNGSHCGYLTECDEKCQLADGDCKRCKDQNPWKAGDEEAEFTNELIRRFLGIYEPGQPFSGDFCQWVQSDVITWLNTENPMGAITMKPFSDNRYIEYASPSRCSG